MKMVYFDNNTLISWQTRLFNFFSEINDWNNPNMKNFGYHILYDQYGIELVCENATKYKEKSYFYQCHITGAINYYFNDKMLFNTIQYYDDVLYGVIIHNKHKFLMFKLKYG